MALCVDLMLEARRLLGVVVPLIERLLRFCSFGSNRNTPACHVILSWHLQSNTATNLSPRNFQLVTVEPLKLEVTKTCLDKIFIPKICQCLDNLGFLTKMEKNCSGDIYRSVRVKKSHVQTREQGKLACIVKLTTTLTSHV